MTSTQIQAKIKEAHAARYPLGCAASYQAMCEDCGVRLGAGKLDALLDLPVTDLRGDALSRAVSQLGAWMRGENEADNDPMNAYAGFTPPPSKDDFRFLLLSIGAFGFFLAELDRMATYRTNARWAYGFGAFGMAAQVSDDLGIN